MSARALIHSRTAALIALTAWGIVAPVRAATNELLKLDNGTLQVGIERGKGGSITWLAWRGHPKNAVNLADPGRLIQQSYYAGRPLDRTAEGQSKEWSPWPWNPIQGGGVGSWARVTQFERTADGTLYSETIPKLWDMPDEEAAARMRQWTRFEPGHSNVIVVRCEFVSQRASEDRWGPAVLLQQEVPALYFTRSFAAVKSYLGNGQWRTESQPPGPPWGQARPPRHAMAAFNAHGQGIAIFSPVADDVWNFGPHGTGNSDNSQAGPCLHIAPLARVPFGPASEYTYRYWLAVGTAEELAATLDTLAAKYAGEKAVLREPTTTAVATKPNLIVIVSDDHRHDALGVVQRELGDQANFPFFQTPHLDRLATGGVRFRNGFVVHSLCSPSRATLLSGLHTHQHGITFNEAPYTATETWPHVLAAHGWRTAYFGKWHMGNQRERPGFQEAATFLNQGIYFDCPFIVNGTNTPSSGWVDDVSTDYALAFIRRQQDRPFALYLGFKAPHDKRTPATRHAQTYANVRLRKPANWNVAPPWNKDAGWDWDRRHADRLAYFQTLAGVDDNVGRVLDLLDELQLTERTLVLYLGDNGYYLGEHGLGDKRTAYEESIRIPFLLRYPRAVKPAVRDELVLNLDIAATLLDAAGLQPNWKQYGHSLLPLVTAAPGAGPWRKSFLYQNYRDPAYPNVTFDVLAVRTETHKYVENNHRPDWTQLFDLRADPAEDRNLINDPAAAEQLAELRRDLARLREETGYVAPPPAKLKN